MRTDIAGFLGYAERGPVSFAPEERPAKLTSWAEFLAAFGGPIRHGNLAYAVKGFFANGGSACYVVRVCGAGVRAARYAQPLAQPDVPMATLTSGAAAAQPELAVSYTGLVGPGEFVAVRGAGGRQVLAVESSGHGRQIRLVRGPHTEVAQGGAVARLAGVTGSTLAQNAAPGQDRIVVTDAAPFALDSLITIHGAGIQELVSVIAVDGATLLLDRKLEANHAAGEAVTVERAAFTIRAASPGSWGNRVRVRTVPLDPGFLSLRVTVDPGDDPTRPVEQEFYRRLATAEVPAAMAAQSRLIRMEGQPDGSGPLDVYLAGGRDGLSGVDEKAFTGGPDDRRGLRLLEDVDEVAILCAPDAVFAELPQAPPPPPRPKPRCDAPPQAKPLPAADDPTALPPVLDYTRIYDAMVEQCRRLRYRVAVLDPPDGLEPQGVLAAGARWMTPEGQFAAMYYPWLKVADALSATGESRRIPPGGHVAGVYAGTDQTSGVQRPPANQAMLYVDDVAAEISNLQQEPLNDGGINVIRAFPGRGIRVWGARSLYNTPPWRFIHARRLMSMIEDSVEKSTAWTVFEPNDDNLRRTLTHALDVFLEAIWRTGGLKGATPAQGYFVKCDESNNPQSGIDAGQLVCQVGVAVAAPMEFLVFDIRRRIEGAEIVEAEA